MHENLRFDFWVFLIKTVSSPLVALNKHNTWPIACIEVSEISNADAAMYIPILEEYSKATREIPSFLSAQPLPWSVDFVLFSNVFDGDLNKIVAVIISKLHATSYTLPLSFLPRVLE